MIDTGTPDLLATLESGVLTLTLNRPEARNAMSRAMNEALVAQLAAAELDPAVKCIVLTGAGKGFCAGGDVKGMAARGDGTVGNNTIDEAIARQRVQQRAQELQVGCIWGAFAFCSELRAAFTISNQPQTRRQVFDSVAYYN